MRRVEEMREKGRHIFRDMYGPDAGPSRLKDIILLGGKVDTV